jgi:nuclear mRNA export protein SAC3
MHFYDDARHAALVCPNEPEFRAYNLLLHIYNSDVIRQTELLPLKILISPPVENALELCTLTQRVTLTSDRGSSSAFPNFFTRFFKRISSPSTTFLEACLLEHHFAEIRKNALATIANSFLSSDKTPAMPTPDVREMLVFDSDQYTAEFASDICSLGVERDGIRLNRKTEIAPS